MQLNLFLEEDLDLFRMECNFSDTESQIFELKAKGKTDVKDKIYTFGLKNL